VTRGDPESPLRWTCKSTVVLSMELFKQHGIRISDKTVAKLVREHDYSHEAPNNPSKAPSTQTVRASSSASWRESALASGCSPELAGEPL
jgi:hypothetical protein